LKGLELIGYANPVFGVGVTMAAYVAALAVQRRVRWLHPLVVTCASLIVLLLAAKIPCESYRQGGDMLKLMLGPATIALGVPLYRQARKIKTHIPAIVLAIMVGSICGLASSALFVWLTHGSRIVLLSMVPKSVTTPISIEISKQLGGDQKFTAVFTVLSGLVGAVFGPALLRLARVRNDIAIGLAIGTSAHGIGTARVIRDNELQGSASGLAMALAGIITSILAIPIYWWLR